MVAEILAFLLFLAFIYAFWKIFVAKDWYPDDTTLPDELTGEDEDSRRGGTGGTGGGSGPDRPDSPR